jgi:hypothetical protein
MFTIFRIREKISLRSGPLCDNVPHTHRHPRKNQSQLSIAEQRATKSYDQFSNNKVMTQELL